MKKILFTLIFACALVSCTDKHYHNDYYEVNKFNERYTIKSEHWEGEDGYFFYEYEEKGINNVLRSGGSLDCFLVSNVGGNEAYLNVSDVALYSEGDGDWVIESINVQYERDYITFIVQYNDFSDTPPPTLTFQVFAMW